MTAEDDIAVWTIWHCSSLPSHPKPFIFTMSSSSAAKQRLQALSKQLVEGIPDEGTFEGIPKIRHIAPDSAGP